MAVSRQHVPLNGGVDLHVDAGRLAGGDLLGQKVALQARMDRTEDCLVAMIVEEAMMAAGEQDDRVDMRLLQPCREFLAVEGVADRADLFGSVEVEVNLAQVSDMAEHDMLLLG